MYDDVLLLVHPWIAPTFVSVVDPVWSNDRISDYVNLEVTRVIGDAFEWQIRYEFVGTDVILGERTDRILITCIPRGAMSINSLMGAPRFEVRCSLSVVASLVSSQEIGRHQPAGTVATIGWYGDRAELSVYRDGSLRLCSFVVDADPVKQVRKLEEQIESVDRLKPGLTRLIVYGTPPEESALRKYGVFSGSQIDSLRPSLVFGDGGKTAADDKAYGLVAAGAFSRLLHQV
jgi:hypothetical protein